MLWIPTQIPQVKVGYQTRIASLGVKMLRCCLYQTSLGMYIYIYYIEYAHMAVDTYACNVLECNVV